jgi:hypothetical protein
MRLGLLDTKKPATQAGFIFGGAKRDRTADLVIANDALSQLSYGPACSHWPLGKRKRE